MIHIKFLTFQLILFSFKLTSLCKAYEELAGSLNPLPPKQYNYDFDFEKAVMFGINPNKFRISTNHVLTSAPGCPEPFDNKPWVYYGTPPKCYLPGYHWPCKENMMLMPQASSFYGYCDCACSYYTGSERTPQSFCLGKDTNDYNRILAYRKEWDSCHFIFDQAKCHEGEWFVFGDNPMLGPYCEKRRCFKEIQNAKDGVFSFFDYKANLCRKIGDKCNGTGSFGNQLVVLPSQYHTDTTDNQWTPGCDTSAPYSAAYRVTESDCTIGTKFSRILKICVPVYKGRNERVG